MGDLLPQVEALLNSLSVSGTGEIVKVDARIPGAIRSSIEKGITLLSGMAGVAGEGLGGPGAPQINLPTGPTGVGIPQAGDNTTGPASPGNPKPPQ